MATERDIISAGVKLLGLCVLVYGVLSIIGAGYQGSIAYHRMQNPPALARPADAASAEKPEIVERQKVELQIHRLVQRRFAIQSVWRIIGGAVVAFIGLSMCRRGEPIVEFLMPEKKQSPPPA